jgi:hypothetical protein
LRAAELSEKQDLVEFFKTFLYFFQYPGGHIKPHETAYMIEQGIHFKPAQYILSLLEYAERTEGSRIGINKAELTHCVFNDLRCTRDNEGVALTWQRIKSNRQSGQTYDWTGDVIRYAGDILDYMGLANLVTTHGNGLYYINWLERDTVYAFIQSDEWFADYDQMIKTRQPNLQLINEAQNQWYDYVNRPVGDHEFETDVLAFISNNEAEYEELKKISQSLLAQHLEEEILETKEIGDWGENLVHGHECERVKLGGRPDIIHLIKVIPTQFAVGYDILSVELDERKRHIEVKTTVSSKPIHFNKFHLTTNEWNSARSYQDRYFVYRLYLSKHERKLYILQNPERLYKDDKLQMTPRNGADIVFNPDDCGQFEELLSWQM